MRTILYATDYSENAAAALRYAYEISRKTDAQIVALNVFSLPAVFVGPGNAKQKFEVEKDVGKEALEQLRAFCEGILDDEKSKLNIRYEVREDKLTVHGITSMINQYEADLVVLGTRGENGFREAFIGSTAMGVIEKASCPVLTVPEEAVYGGFDRIAYATDFEDADVEAIKALTEIAMEFNAEMHVIHILSDREYEGSHNMDWFSQRIEEEVGYENTKFETLVRDDVYEAMNNYVRNRSISLIAMLEREKERLVDRWFHRDLVKRMEFNTIIPLLSFNENFITRVAREKLLKESKTE